MKIAYFGTPDFSADFLKKILEDDELGAVVFLVVTQPDKKVGKKQVLTPSPVKVLAKKFGIPVKTELSIDYLKEIDLAVLFAYGEILPQEILDTPKNGFWNIHPSLLPKYRGASPVAAPLMNGDTETGVSLMKMDNKMDHGPIVGQKTLIIEPKETRDKLTSRLVDTAYQLFKEELQKFPENTYTEQDHTQATTTKILSRDDGFVKLGDLKGALQGDGVHIFNLYRGLHPWPGVWTKVEIEGQEKRLKITNLDIDRSQLIINKVQLEGKNEVDFKQFNEAYKIF